MARWLCSPFLCLALAESERIEAGRCGEWKKWKEEESLRELIDPNTKR